MAKFNYGDKLYWIGDNSQVTVLKVYDKPNENQQAYLVRHDNGVECNERETDLFKSDKIFKGAKFRVEEEVYLQSTKRGVKPVWQVIIDVYKDEEYGDEVLYKCRNANGEENIYTSYNLSLYERYIISRNSFE